MCTLSWLGDWDAALPSAGRTGDFSSYEVHFNRDEKHVRLPAEPPGLFVRSGVRFMAPRDGDAGGSWIAVNDHGVTLCLLNRHHESMDDSGKAFISRGQLVLGVATVSSADEAAKRLADEPLENYQPFDLLVFSREEAPRAFSFSGERLVSRVLGDRERPLSSSSRDHPGVMRVRRGLLEKAMREGELDSARLQRLHASHEPERGVYSFCMHREEARTVSYSRIRVNGWRASFAYADGSPCETALAPELVLDLRRDA